MLLVGSILLAVFYLPPVWDVVVVSVAAVVELAETAFWIWLSKQWRIRAGAETLIGARGVATTDVRPAGQVRVQGELWQARSEAGAAAGERVRVVERDGLTLTVEPDR
jgi:membrane protein implicated in regulation of membrane protease activity